MRLLIRWIHITDLCYICSLASITYLMSNGIHEHQALFKLSIDALVTRPNTTFLWGYGIYPVNLAVYTPCAHSSLYNMGRITRAKQYVVIYVWGHAPPHTHYTND